MRNYVCLVAVILILNGSFAEAVSLQHPVTVNLKLTYSEELADTYPDNNTTKVRGIFDVYTLNSLDIVYLLYLNGVLPSINGWSLAIITDLDYYYDLVDDDEDDVDNNELVRLYAVKDGFQPVYTGIRLAMDNFAWAYNVNYRYIPETGSYKLTGNQQVRGTGSGFVFENDGSLLPFDMAFSGQSSFAGSWKSSRVFLLDGFYDVQHFGASGKYAGSGYFDEPGCTNCFAQLEGSISFRQPKIIPFSR